MNNYDNNARYFANFKKLEKVYTEYMTDAVADFALSPNEIEVISCLKSISSAKEIALQTDVSKGLVSRSVNSLRKKGYIAVSVSQKDKREQCLMLTEQGKVLCDKIDSAREMFFDKAFQHYESTERQVFDALVNLMLRNLDITNSKE